LIRIPFRSLGAYYKNAEKIVSHLEAKFSWPVVVIGNRVIISKWGKNFNILFSLTYMPFPL